VRIIGTEKIIINYFCKIKKTIITKNKRQMDFIKAVSIIGRDLEEAIALLDQLAAEGGSNLPEIELARLRVRSATELLKLLPGLSRTNIPDLKAEVPLAAELPVTEVSEPAANVTASAKAPEPAAKVTAAAKAPEPVTKEIPEVEIPEPVTAVITEADTEEPVKARITMTKATESHKTQDPQKAILADRFATTGTLGEKMQSAKPEGAISSVMHSKPIADIGAAIGMNDKFYFIRELFSGDSIAYHDTIRRLNAAASLGEAMKILDESTVMGSDPSAQSSFVDVVRRKFNIHV